MTRIIIADASKVSGAARDARWQRHYDEYIESFDGVFSHITGPIAAEQYADDMMDEEERKPREPYVPSPEYLAWCAAADSKRTTVVHGDPLRRLA